MVFIFWILKSTPRLWKKTGHKLHFFQKSIVKDFAKIC